MESTQLPRVRKEGVYKKLKTSKKKYFILREQLRTVPASLEYHDSEKKVKPDAKPKRSVPLNSCLSINTKFDAKNAHTLVLFLQEDCLGMVFETEAEQQEWYHAIEELMSEAGGQAARYDHVWQVVVKPEGLASGKTLQSGIYRLCLSKKTLLLIPVNKKLSEIEFQLATIRRCAHKKAFFMLESGSAASTGAGELWMQVDDSVVARSIHDTVLKSMKSNPGESMPQPFRGRSQTHGTSERPHRASTKRNSMDGASTLPRRQKAKSMHVPASEFNTSPSLKRPSHSPHKTGSVYGMRPKSSFVDFTAVSPGQSPHVMSPLSQEMRDRTDSWESRGSYRMRRNSSLSEECDVELSVNVPKASVPPISMEMSDYLAMTTVTSPSKDSVVHPEERTEGYMEMSSPVSSAPCLKTLAASPIMSSDSGYLEMQPVAAGGSLHKLESSDLLERPDKVPSLLSDTDSVEEFPKRTYSLGSKPPAVQAAIGQSSAYMDMHCVLDKGNPRTCSAPHLFEETTERGGSPFPNLSNASLSHSSSRSATPCGIPEHPSDLMELHFDGKANGSHESLSDFRSRTSSGSSRDIGYHTSSFDNSEFRDRTDSSCSRDSTYRVQIMDKFRLRTQTVCQDVLRPRASSQVIEESMRPRSFSHGTSRFRELSKRLKEKTQRHPTSGDHSRVTKRLPKNASRESMGADPQHRASMADSEYIDINVIAASDTANRKTSDSKCQAKRTVVDEYMVIHPAEGLGDYETMTVKRHPSPQDAVTQDSQTSSKNRGKGKPPYSRKETSFKHSSSSESVSSTSSTDFVAKSNKKSSIKPSSANPDYFELQPGGVADSYTMVSHQPKVQNVSSGHRVAINEDSYSVMDPRDTQGKLYEDMAPAGESSLAEIFQGLDKVVSPIREEDNEALFGPKPTGLNNESLEKLQKTLKHEYVNLKFNDVKPSTVCSPTGLKTQDTVQYSEGSSSGLAANSHLRKRTSDAAEAENPVLQGRTGNVPDPQNPVSQERTDNVADTQKSHSQETTGNNADTQNMKENTADIKPWDRQCSTHEYCEINYDEKSSVDAAPTKNENEVKPQASTPAPFELVTLNLSPLVMSNKKPSPPPVEEETAAILDVFNLGAVPSGISSTPTKSGSMSDTSDHPDVMATSTPNRTSMQSSMGNHASRSGSVASLASIESISAATVEPRLRTRHSNSCLTSMDKTTDRLSYQEVGSKSGGDTFIRRQSSQASLSDASTTAPSLNYVTLDLSGSQDETSFPQSPAAAGEQVSPGIKSRLPPLTAVKKTENANTGQISYAEIDFEQCSISSPPAAEKDKP